MTDSKCNLKSRLVIGSFAVNLLTLPTCQPQTVALTAVLTVIYKVKNVRSNYVQKDLY